MIDAVVRFIVDLGIVGAWVLSNNLKNIAIVSMVLWFLYGVTGTLRWEHLWEVPIIQYTVQTIFLTFIVTVERRMKQRKDDE